jgi:hypothetical protein
MSIRPFVSSYMDSSRVGSICLRGTAMADDVMRVPEDEKLRRELGELADLARRLREKAGMDTVTVNRLLRAAFPTFAEALKELPADIGKRFGDTATSVEKDIGKKFDLTTQKGRSDLVEATVKRDAGVPGDTIQQKYAS